jgi:RNA polymerase sigma factor (TIGR02999 family)
MASPPDSQVTQLLKAAGNGDKVAADRLWTTVYERLHRIAQGLLGREPTPCSLQPTSLIGAIWERIDLGDVDWADRGHFFAVATKVLRRVLTEEARARKRLKRDAGRAPLALDEEPAAADEDHLMVLAVAEALERLEQINPRWARIVQLRHFEGLGVDETAEVLRVCPKTVTNGWAAARVCLHQELSKGDSTCAERNRRG